jgi:hypothetical protein
MRVTLVVHTVGILFILPTIASANSPLNQDIAARAETAFRLGMENKARLLQARQHFSAATDAYVELHARGIRTPALYRSLGNAAVLADRWSEAIWAYHVGLRLDPNDDAMREQLAYVRAKVLLPAAGQGRPDPNIWPGWMYRASIDELTLLFGAFYAWTWLVCACAFVQRKPRLVMLTVGLVISALIVGAGLWLEMRQARIDRDTPLVVMAANADFHRGNGPSYPKHPVLPTLPRGLEARQTHRRGDWLQIRLTTGETGWVHVAQVLIVEP